MLDEVPEERFGLYEYPGEWKASASQVHLIALLYFNIKQMSSAFDEIAFQAVTGGATLFDLLGGVQSAQHASMIIQRLKEIRERLLEDKEAGREAFDSSREGP